ncbi:MAG: murein hydrolase activator EnvC [Bdellovibrionales bacterium]
MKFFSFILGPCLLSGTAWAQLQTAPPVATDQQVQVTKDRLIAAEQAERQLLGTLYSINQRMKDMSQKRDRLTDRRMATEGDVRLLARHIADLEWRLQAQRAGMGRRLRGLYLMNGQTAMRSLFSAQSALEFDRNLRFLKTVTDRDYGLIKDYQKSLHVLTRKRRQLDGQVRSLARIHGALKKQEQRLQEDQEAKNLLLSRLQNSQNQHLNELQRLRDAQAKSGVTTQELNTAFFERRGQLQRPVEGELVKSYGFVQDETYRFRLGHKGWFLRAGAKDPVKSVFQGRVAYAGDLPGYGKTAILDHGDHYYTVYGHMTNLKVGLDQEVKEGQTVGLAGGISPWFGTGAYFEIRHFSDAIDPQPWFKSM